MKLTHEERFLLLQLAQECAEVTKEVTKVLIFGLDAVNPNDVERGSNRNRMADEVVDLEVAINTLCSKGIIPGRARSHYVKRANKVRKWLKYSERRVNEDESK